MNDFSGGQRRWELRNPLDLEDLSLGPASRAAVHAQRALLKFLGRRDRLCQMLLNRQRGALERGIDPDTALVLELAEITRQGSLGHGSPDDERRRMKESIAVADERPDGIVLSTQRTVRGAVGLLDARLYEPKGIERPSPGIVYVHGGGWVTGDLETHDAWCRRLALLGRMRVIAIQPRLAPEDPFPATVDDTIAAFRHVASQAESFGIDPKRLGMAGDSAGGNLSAIVGLETREDAIRPALTGLLYPALDATCTQPSVKKNGTGFLLTEISIAWYLNHYIGQDQALRTNPRVSPLHAKDLRGVPPAFIAVAGFDPLIDEGVAYAKRLESETEVKVDLVRYDSLIHGFLLMAGLSRAARAAADEIATRLGDLLRR